MTKLAAVFHAFRSHLVSLVGSLFILCSVCIELWQPHNDPVFTSGEPSIPWLDLSRMLLSVSGAALLLGDAFRNISVSRTMQNEIKCLKELISQQPNKTDLDRLKQDIELVRKTVEKKQNDIS